MLKTDEDEDNERCRDDVVTLQTNTQISAILKTHTLTGCVSFVSHHVPHEVSHPVEQRLHTADEVHVFGFADALLDEVDHEAGRDEGHGKDHADRHQDINRGGHPGDGKDDDDQ